METDLAEVALPTIISEITAIETDMRTNRPAYNRDTEKQARLRHLYDRRAAVQAPTVLDEDSQGMEALMPVLRSDFYKQCPDGDYALYAKYLRHCGDVMLPIPSGERRSFVARFESLPDGVVQAMMTELANTATVVHGRCTEKQVRDATRINGGSVIHEWGQEAPEKMARVRARLERMLMTMETDRDVSSFMDWLAGLSDGAARAVYRKLAQ